MEKQVKLKQRIKYVEKDGKLISIKELVSKNGAKYMVFIDLATKTYVIRNVNTLRKFEGGENINNMNVLKRTIKKHLFHLGVCFESESRQRSFGLCPKNYSESIHRAKKKEQQEIDKKE